VFDLSELRVFWLSNQCWFSLTFDNHADQSVTNICSWVVVLHDPRVIVLGSGCGVKLQLQSINQS